jgi:acetyltransferase-like isoleucine patch superfamily enzyme
MKIQRNFIARDFLKLRAFDKFNNQKFTPSISIGENVQIETNCHIGCINKIEIGDNVLIASDVSILDHLHGKTDFSDISISPINRILTSKGPIKIGDNVLIGEKVTILSGVSIGQGSIIGANSIVTRDIPENSIAVGSPARIIKKIQ